MTTDSPRYSHTQKAPTYLILCASALFCFALAWIIREPPWIFVFVGAGLLIGLLAPMFRHLTVEDRGEVLAIRFGPVPLFRRTVR